MPLQRRRSVGRVLAITVPLPLLVLPSFLEWQMCPMQGPVAHVMAGFWLLLLFAGIKSPIPAFVATGVYLYLLAAAGLNAVTGQRDRWSRRVLSVVLIASAALLFSWWMGSGWNAD